MIFNKFIFLFFAPIVAYTINYEVRFIGLNDEAALNAVLETSQLVSLQHRPPASMNGLRYRTYADIPALIRVLHAFSYYDASIRSEIKNVGEEARVDIFIDPGQPFSLKSYRVYDAACLQPLVLEGCACLTPDHLGLHLEKPAKSIEIVNAELDILNELSKCGYPLATIDHRSVEVDMSSKTVEASSCVLPGPFALFGSTTYSGLENTKQRFIEQNIGWQEGCPYNSKLVSQSQERLLNTELFSSVYISHDETLDANGSLPLKVKVTEARHRKITLGAFYATVNGPGGNITWTHRNLRGMGESIVIKGEYAEKSYTGSIVYKVPNFLNLNQLLRANLQLDREKIFPYRSLRYRFKANIERNLSSHGTIAYGIKADHFRVTHSARDGTFALFGLPIFGKYDRSNDPLNPTQGYTLVYSITPYQSMDEGHVRFAKQRLTGTCYIPLIPSRNIVLALRTQFGSIAGTKARNVPLPKLFLGGSENELRGYRYQSVSPLEGTKPLGGRSAVYATAELRFRFFGKIGVVPFADFGTVTNSELPDLDTKWLKSLGIGLRYYAFFGPLRFDIGFPLDKRKHVDSNYQIYASVGQAF